MTANPAIQDNRCRTVLALGAHRVGELDLDEGEDIGVDEVALDDVGGLIESGRMNHALVIAGYWWFEHWRRQHAATLARYLD